MVPYNHRSTYKEKTPPIEIGEGTPPIKVDMLPLSRQSQSPSMVDADRNIAIKAYMGFIREEKEYSLGGLGA